MDIIDSVREIARKELSRNKGSHDWDHTERVYALALRIAEKTGADFRIVSLASLLHDIERNKEDESGGIVSHADAGALSARSILSGLGLEKAAIEAVAHCVESHRFRGEKKPASIEAMVLFDADKLDSIGAVGIGRAFLFAGEVGAKLHNRGIDIRTTAPYTVEDTAYREYMVKLRFIKDKMLTTEGRRIASERHDYMVGFFERLAREVEGML